MPINTFDASEMKQNLNSYIAEINDLATSPEFVDKYAKESDITHHITHISTQGLSRDYHAQRNTGLGEQSDT